MIALVKMSTFDKQGFPDAPRKSEAKSLRGCTAPLIEAPAMKLIKSLKICLAAGIVAVLTSGAAFAGEWTGKYMTEDTKGNPFSISLADNGTAAGTKHGTALSGTWTDEGDAAVIKWSTGWTTKISKDGDHYKKAAYRAGAPMKDGPTHTTGVEKIE